jgi:hypothetical protein
MISGKGTLALALAAGVCGSAAAAIPTVSFNVSSAAGSNGSSLTGDAVAGSPGQYQYLGTAFVAQSFVCSVELFAMDTSASSRAVFGGLVTLINASNSTQSYVVTMTGSTVAQGTSSIIGGNVSGVLSATAAGATFTAGGASPGWTGSIGSSTVQTMMTAPLSVSAGPSLSVAIPTQSFGVPIPSLASPVAMGTSTGLRMEFSLTAGARVDLTSVFVVQAVPAPGALVAMAIAAAAPRRRRR